MRSPFSWRPLNIQMVPKLQLVLRFTAASQNHQAFSLLSNSGHGGRCLVNWQMFILKNKIHGGKSSQYLCGFFSYFLRVYSKYRKCIVACFKGSQTSLHGSFIKYKCFFYILPLLPTHKNYSTFNSEQGNFKINFRIQDRLHCM